MILRRIIEIDEAKCNGCGACAEACHEGAIVMVDGKARLIRDDYCDGLGDCLPACPVDALHFVDRQALPFDEAAVQRHRESRSSQEETLPEAPAPSPSLRFPIQIKLMPVKSPAFDGAKLLVAADCSAYLYPNFHTDFMEGHVTVIGCPKLDQVDYSDKLAAILRENDIRSLTLARMQVPCCGGLERAVRQALQASGKYIPWRIVTLSTDGRIVDSL